LLPIPRSQTIIFTPSCCGAQEGRGRGVGGKGKNNGKKGPKAKGATTADSEALSRSSNIKLLFAALSSLLLMSIPPPSPQADVLCVVKDLKTKKAWFEMN
jgi:hypothetical protein